MGADGEHLLKSSVLLDNYDLPGELERQVAAFVSHYNHARHHEILAEHDRIKRTTIANRRLQYQLRAA